MKLSEVLSVLDAPEEVEIHELLQPYWESSAASVPQDWDLLQPEKWRENRDWCGCDTTVDDALEAVVAEIIARPALRSLAWHCHRLIFETSDYARFSEWTRLIPLLDRIEPGLSGAFFLWLSLGAAPRLRAKNATRGVPEAITRGTLEDIAIVVRRFARYNDGAIGIQPRLYTWHRLVSSGDLHRIGRFEYVARPFHGRLRAYRHRATKRVIALSDSEMGYDSEGYLVRAGETPAWNTTLVETEATICGHPVSPRGFVLPQPIELQSSDWQCVLAPGELVLEIHIPEGESLTPQSCRDSFEKARAFYAEYYPEYLVKSFACYSWLFNTQFETLLPTDSKLLAWQRECYLFPVPSSGKDGLYFVFGQDEIDPATAPRDTLLRRAFADHLASAKQLRNGGMFFCFEELPQYGTQVYRRMEQEAY